MLVVAMAALPGVVDAGDGAWRAAGPKRRPPAVASEKRMRIR